MLPTGPLFIAIAVIFLGVALRNYLQEENKMTPARSTYLRVAFIFVACGIVLQVIGWFVQ